MSAKDTFHTQVRNALIREGWNITQLDDLEDALGQYGIYQAILELREPERLLYLALPNGLRELLLEEKDFRHILRAFGARLIFYDPQEQEALEWIEPTSFA